MDGGRQSYEKRQREGLESIMQERGASRAPFFFLSFSILLLPRSARPFLFSLQNTAHLADWAATPFLFLNLDRKNFKRRVGRQAGWPLSGAPFLVSGGASAVRARWLLLLLLVKQVVQLQRRRLRC